MTSVFVKIEAVQISLIHKNCRHLSTATATTPQLFLTNDNLLIKTKGNNLIGSEGGVMYEYIQLD